MGGPGSGRKKGSGTRVTSGHFAHRGPSMFKTSAQIKSSRARTKKLKKVLKARGLI